VTALAERLDARDPARPVVAPVLQRHAARLEQLPWVRLLSDAEAVARALRTAHGLYGVDVVVGGAPGLVAVACRTAAAPGMSPAAAQAGALPELPDPQLVAGQPVLEVLADGLERTRATIGADAGIGLVLPAAADLAAQVGRLDAADWCHQVLVCVLSRVGAIEPDLVVQVGASSDVAALEGMCRFYGATIVHAGAQAAEGVVALPGSTFAEPDAVRPVGWLYTSADELPEGLDPRAVRETIASLRAPAPGAHG
jgi:hypothetical protein